MNAAEDAGTLAVVGFEEIYLRSNLRFLLRAWGLPPGLVIEFIDAFNLEIESSGFCFDQWSGLDEVRVLLVERSPAGGDIHVLAEHRPSGVRFCSSYPSWLLPDRLGRQPPRNAEFLLYLCLGRRQRQEMLPDLAEEYVEVVKQFGKRRADLWYWSQALRSIPSALGVRLEQFGRKLVAFVFSRR